MIVYILAASIGVVLSGVWAWYIREVAAGRAILAAISDGVLLTLNFAQYQLWASRGNDIVVFAAIIAGSMLGTYLYIIWRNNVQRGRSVAVPDWHARERTEAASPSGRTKSAAIGPDVRCGAETVPTDGTVWRGDVTPSLRGPQPPSCS